MKFQITFVRHGETDYNHRGIIQGQSINCYLNETGKLQALKLGKALSDEQFSKTFCSDLNRAKETCQIVLEENKYGKDVEIKFDVNLRERSYGDYEGRKVEEFQSRDKAKSGLKAGETLKQVKVRCKTFFDQLCYMMSLEEDVVNCKILVVSHGRYLSTMFSYIIEQFGCEINGYNSCKKLLNASRSCFEVTIDDGLKFTSFKTFSLSKSANKLLIKCVLYNHSDMQK